MRINDFNSLDQRHQGRVAMTLTEILVAIGISSLLLLGIMSMFMFSNRSFVAMGNYVALDRYSRNAADQMGRQIRAAAGLAAFSTNMPKSLTFSNVDGSIFTYRWISNATESTIYYISQSGSSVLLTNVEVWNFKICQRTPTTAGNYEFHLATNTSRVLDPKECKLIDMNWKCSRTILGKKANTEVVQTAQIVLRNKKATR